MKDKKKIKKRGRILFLISTIVLIMLAILVVYFAFYYKKEINGSKIVTSADFTKCTTGTCIYKVELDNEIYELKYVNIDNPEGEGLEAILSKLYLNDKVIINNIMYDKVLDMNQLNDLLVFGKHRGTSPDGQYLEVFNNKGTLVSKINILDEELEMYPSPVKEIVLGEDGYSDLRIDDYFYEIKNSKLVIYGTRFNDSWQMKINNTYSMTEDLPELILAGEISASEAFFAKYEITYDQLLNGEKPKLKEVIQTVGEVAKVFEE